MVNGAPDALAVGDVDGDSLPDIVVAASVEGFVTVLGSRGAPARGTFIASPMQVGYGPASIAIADFDGDGQQDIAVCNINGDSVNLLRSATAKVFGWRDLAAGSATTAVAALDVDGDGRVDLVASGGDTGRLVLFHNSGAGSFAAPIIYGGVGNTR